MPVTYDVDIHNAPLYTLREAARYVGLPEATVRYWLGRRRTTSPPLIHAEGQLSFLNLVELHVLKALRESHAVNVRSVRAALEYAENTLHIDRLLLHEGLLTAAGDLFVEHYGTLISLSRHGQIAMKALLAIYLQRVERDEMRLPVRLYPLVTGAGDSKPIMLDPRVAFGKPVIQGRGIATWVIAHRLDAGETIETIADDYEIPPELVRSAAIYSGSMP